MSAAPRITVGTGPTPERRQQFREWWHRNGLGTEDPVGPVRIDTVRRTVTFTRVVDVSEPGDLDFPELRRDIENKPLTEELSAPLLVDPPPILWSRDSESKVA